MPFHGDNMDRTENIEVGGAGGDLVMIVEGDFGMPPAFSGGRETPGGTF